MASNNNQSNNNFAEIFSFFNPQNIKNVDFQQLSQLQQQAAEVLNQVGKTIFDSAQKIAKSEVEFIQEQAQTAANVASKALSAGTPEQALDAQTRYAQHYFDSNLQNMQSVAKSASDTAVKVLGLINDHAVESMSSFAGNSKRKAS